MHLMLWLVLLIGINWSCWKWLCVLMICSSRHYETFIPKIYGSVIWVFMTISVSVSLPHAHGSLVSAVGSQNLENSKGFWELLLRWMLQLKAVASHYRRKFSFMNFQDLGKHLENVEVHLLHLHIACLKIGSSYKAWVWICVQISFNLKERSLSCWCQCHFNWIRSTMF